MENIKEFEKEVCGIINKLSLENLSNTPDYIIARYLTNCLINFNNIVNSRDRHIDIFK